MKNDEKLAKYKEAVGYIAKNQINHFFGNKGANHAEIVLENLISNSNDIIRIFTGGLNGEVSNSQSFKNALEAFFNKPDTKLFLLHTKNAVMDTIGANLIKQKADELKGRIKLKEITDEFIEEIHKILDVGEFFTLGDDDKVRIETEPEKLEAIVNFNNKTIVKVLTKAFDNEFNKQNN
ncbi:MAG: hypothetical protein R2764_08340 [Bacteroidales bacterium]